MGSQFSSDPTGDGPEDRDAYEDSDSLSTAASNSSKDCSSESCEGSDSSYDPDKDRKLAKKMLNARRSKDSIHEKNARVARENSREKKTEKYP